MKLKPTIEDALQNLNDEHNAARDEFMQKARKWRAYAFERDDIGALYQADAFVKCARESNDHALATKPSMGA